MADREPSRAEVDYTVTCHELVRDFAKFRDTLGRVSAAEQRKVGEEVFPGDRHLIDEATEHANQLGMIVDAIWSRA